MTDYTELKRLAEAALRNWPDSKLFERPECERFIDSARPDVVLALIAENELVQMQLVACGVVASSNTRESAEHQRDMHPDYMSASCQDVIRAVDREIDLREERDQLKTDIESLRKDLESHKRMLLAAACDLGAIGEALGAEMDDDGSELEGIAAELRKDTERLQSATALVQKLCDAAGNQPSVATGYLHDILSALGKGEQS